MKTGRIYKKRLAALLCAGVLAAAGATVPVRAENFSGEEAALFLQAGEGQEVSKGNADDTGDSEKTVEPPQIGITREDISEAIEGGKDFETNLIIDNSSQEYPLKDVKLTLEGSSELVLREPTNTISLGTIKEREQKNCRIRLKTEPLITASAQTMQATLEYSYDTPEGSVRESIQTEVIFPTVPTDDGEGGDEPEDIGQGDTDAGFSDGSAGDGGSSESTDSEKKTLEVATPNVIVSHYDYGGQVDAGQEFVLHLEIKNTSTQTAVGNMIMAVETGEALAITNASNSTYIDNINPQETVNIDLPMKALSDGKMEGSRLEISFKYEYVAKDTRTQATSTEKIGIPVVQPDKYIVSEPVLESEIHQSSETTVSLPYVNKGKATIYNVEAKLESDDNLEISERYQYLGNLEAGASGTVDFIVIPQKKGSQNAKVRITYEDSANKQREIVKEIKMKVLDEAADDMDMYGMGEADDAYTQETPPVNWKKYGILGGGTAVVLLAAGIVYKKKKQTKTLLLEGEDDEEDDW